MFGISKVGPSIKLAIIFQMAASISTSEKFKLRNITVSEARKELKEFKSNKAKGVDSIQSGLLKDGADPGFSIVCHSLFNLAIKPNVIPAEWKKAKVTPLYK